MRAWWLAIAGVAAISFAGGGLASRARARRSEDRLERRSRIVAAAVETIRRNYVDEIPADSLYLQASRSLLGALHDPYAELMLADAYRRFSQQMSGTRIELDRPRVPTDGGAVSAAGLGVVAPGTGIAPGDEILAVDGHSTRGLTDAEAADLLAADTAAMVTLLVRPRGSDQPVLRRVARTAVHVSAVTPGVMIDDGIGYLVLHSVTEASPRELRDAIQDLRTQGMRSLVLDLRRNPGGLIAQAMEIAELFLDANDTIAVTRGRSATSSRTYVARSNQAWPGMPLVLLVNRQTASSAEVIAAALQDHDRALIVGNPTYGKGVIQTTYPLGSDAAVKFTTSRWFAPSGRSIQRTAADSAHPGAAPRPEFRSDAGRPLSAGHGVTPDLTLRPRLADGAALTYLRQVHSAPGAYQVALATAASAVLAHLAVRPAFVVTDAMRDELWSALTEHGVPLTRDVFDAAEGEASRDLGYEITRQRWGEAAEIRRRAVDDRVVQNARALLDRARTPRALLTLTQPPSLSR